MSTPDYSEFKTAPAGNAMSAVSETAKQLLAAEREVERLEGELKAAQQRVRHLSEHELPRLMEDVGLGASCSLPGGVEVKVNEVLRGSIPKAKEDLAYKWLEENNSGKLIKREFVISFGKDEEAWANKFAADLAKRKKPLQSKVKRTVHPQTLLAALKEWLKEGKAVPLDVFGVFRQRVASVKVKED